MQNWIPQLVELTAHMDARMLALLAFLAFLLVLLAWKLVEGLAAVFFELISSLTPKGRLAEQQRHKTIQAEVDAIMAKLKSESALFQGPPKPPARWQIWLRRVGRVMFYGWLGLWSYGVWHFYQLAQITAARIAFDEARNPLFFPSLRTLHNEDPGKSYALAAFLALQVLAVVIGSVWDWYKDRQPVPQNQLTDKPAA